MNRTEAERVLRLRRVLTNESLSDDTVDGWADALAGVPYGEGVRAMRAAAMAHDRVNLHSLWEHITTSRADAERTTQPHPRCELCDGTGWVEAPPLVSDRVYGTGPRKGEPISCSQVTQCSCHAHR